MGSAMGKAATRKRTTNNNSDPALDYLSGLDMKSQLISASLNLGWQLALTVLIPIFIGVQIDRKFDSSPSWTLTALFLAIAGSAVILSRTFKELNRTQEADIKAASKRKRSKKKERVDA